MKKKNIQYRFIEWSSPDELHQDSLLWRSQLQFIADEQHFLDELITNHTTELISIKLYKKTKEIVGKLKTVRKQLDKLLVATNKHINGLEILVDGIDELVKEKEYKQDHYVLKVKILRYLEDYNKTKKEIFNLVKVILREGREKRLLK